ncbi:uridine kinase [Nonomuraea sediminis]|uniref:uridine kinase n=1 Tax=Nonomuraea sediminis TaxID=2835864 RepID=UPI00202ABE47|nr:uridine kinase [Nonomuraea sediminis]
MDVLVGEVVGRIDGVRGRVRVAVDGTPAAEPGRLADALVDPLRVLGRSVVRVSAGDFLRPASLRFEFGREDPDIFYDDWLDVKALRREVLEGRDGRVLPKLWDAAADRAYRVPYEEPPANGVIVVDGALLLGRGLPFEVVVHLWLSGGALARRTPPEQSWTLPAYERYEREARPRQLADFVVKADDPRHLARVIS